MHLSLYLYFKECCATQFNLRKSKATETKVTSLSYKHGDFMGDFAAQEHKLNTNICIILIIVVVAGDHRIARIKCKIPEYYSLI